MEDGILKILEALEFSADKHKYQRRKGDENKIPYINHPIQVAKLIAEYHGTGDSNLLIGALLHDTIEDTQTTPEEIKEKFGEDVLDLVLEVTDDKNLPSKERKKLQVLNAKKKTDRAKLIKLADKICNVKDISTSPPANWSRERVIEYIQWAKEVVSGLNGINTGLEGIFNQISDKTLQKLMPSSIK